MFVASLVGFLLAASPLLAQGPPLLNLSAADHPGFSRVTIASTIPLEYTVEKKSASLLITIETDKAFRFQRSPFQSRFVKSIGWSQGTENCIIIVETRVGRFNFYHYIQNNPYQLVIDLKEQQEKSDGLESDSSSTNIGKPGLPGGKTEGIASQGEKRAREAVNGTAAIVDHPSVPSSGADTLPSLPSAERGSSGQKRIKTIVIDPGHGGMETGAKGKFGTMEKDITLAISLKLKAVIERNLSFRVILTREKDTDVALENRAALANNHKADLFISIHANGSSRKKAEGSESFFLSLNATDEEARRLAYLENTQTELQNQIDQGSQEDVKMILWDMAQAAFIKQSSRLAEIIQDELNELLGTRNRGIKQAPFKVLTGVASPAVLVEVAFISNPDEEKKLLSEPFQNNVAEAIYRGLAKYLKLYS
jgi:N-acetylmuramoyl-L-alanine amidase